MAFFIELLTSPLRPVPISASTMTAFLVIFILFNELELTTETPDSLASLNAFLATPEISFIGLERTIELSRPNSLA